MKTSTTFKLAALVIILAGAVWQMEKRLKVSVSARTRPFASVRMDDIDFLFCAKDDLKVECSRKSRGWFVDYPVKARADVAIVARLLSMLEGLDAAEVITLDQRVERDLSLDDYGLAQPSVRIKAGGKYFLKELLVGEPAPVGDAVYVKFADEQEVYAVPDALTNALPASLSLFRDAHILPGNPSKAMRLEIHQPGGFVQMVRKPTGWWIQQPFLAPADGAAVDRILSQLFALKAEQYVWDPPLQPDGEQAVQAGGLLSIYGFAEDVSPARIAVWANGEEIGREVIFGKAVADAPGQIYARRKAFESIFAVSEQLAPVRSVSAVDLRDKLIFSVVPTEVKEVCLEEQDSRIVLHRDAEAGWSISEPVKWQADDDHVNNFVSALARLEVGSYGATKRPEDLKPLRLDPPEFSIGMSTLACQQNPGNVSETERKTLGECNKHLVTFGYPDTNGVRHIILPAGQMATLTKDGLRGVDVGRLTDPLRYRERNVLALNSKNVRKIDLEIKDMKESVALSSNGVWLCASDPGRTVNTQVVNDVLLIAANLRALGFESLNPKNLSGYGLEPAAVSLTLGLTGDEGIQKTIMLGYKSGNDGIYGLIKGQDLLLILHRKIAEILSRNLLLPPRIAEGETAEGKSGPTRQ